MRKLCIIFSFIIIPILSKSQAINDSITIYVENRIEINLVLEDYDLLKKDSNELVKHVRQFQSFLPELASKMDQNVSELIEYQNGKQITVEAVNSKEIFLIQDGKPVNTGLRDGAILNLSWVKIEVTGKDLSSIQDIDLANCIEKMMKQLPEKSRSAKSFYYQCISGEISAIEDLEQTNSYGDYIELTTGVGAHVIQNELLGDFTFQLNLRFNRKGVLEHNPYLSTNLLYDYTLNNKVNINTFLNVGYRWNRARSDEKENPFGVEVGYLIGRQGSFFDKNTARFGLNWSPAKGVTVSPQVYFIDGFKKINPGLRIGFGL